MSLDLAYDDGQQAIRDALDQFCADHCDDTAVKALVGRFPTDLWRELCELGVLEAALPESDGGALEVAAAMEALGRWVVPGPWCAGVLAARVLPEGERARVAAGETVVSAGVPPLMPWATHADVFLSVEGGEVWRLEASASIEEVSTLGGEPWGRGEFERRERLSPAAEAHAYADVSHAAYLASAGERLLEVTADHARARVQFGKSIGEFQAVAHPMADCHMTLAAAAALARAAAWRIDRDEWSEAMTLASAARLSANHAAVETSYVCQQVFGAVGITLEGPAYHFTRRIRQMASAPPGGEPAREALLAYIDLAQPLAAEASTRGGASA